MRSKAESLIKWVLNRRYCRDKTNGSTRKKWKGSCIMPEILVIKLRIYFINGIFNC